MDKGLIYIYCITGENPGQNVVLATRGVDYLNFNGLYIVRKLVSEEEFSEENLKRNINNIEWLEEKARDHIEVIQLIMKTCSVVPFRFGTIFQTEENLFRFINTYSSSLVENLELADRKEEWAVKVFCNRIKIADKIDDLSPEAAMLEKQIMASSPGRAFLLKKKKNETVEREIDLLYKNYSQLLFNEISQFSSRAVITNLLPKDFTGRDEDMILNAAFLVLTGHVKDFGSTIYQLKQKYAPIGIEMEVTGPWPPFSFTSIKEIKDAG
jgi:hypothetical protein